jgi:hypothetical protein
MSTMTKESMKKWFVRLYLPALLLVMTGGMLFVLKFGYKPVPPMVMTPSFFDRPAEIGAVVFRRFYAEIRERHVVVFGSPAQPAFHRDVLAGFLAAAAQDGAPFGALVVEEQMPDVVTPEGLRVVRVPSNTETQAELIDAIREAEGKNQRVLVYLPSVFSTHLLKGNPIHRLEKTLGHALFSITSAPLALANDQEYLVDPSCVGSERDNLGVSDLGCAILAAGRPFYKKMIKANHSESENAKAKPDNQRRWVAIMNQPTQGEDYLLMISSPGQDKGNAPENRELRMNPPGGAGGPIR